MSAAGTRWICCQLGAREHYMVPSALTRRGVLQRLVTDRWIPPGHPAAALTPRLRDRFHRDLAGTVTAFNFAALAYEARAALTGAAGWPRMMQRNEWFQAKAGDWLRHNLHEGSIVASYSYAARGPFQVAKSRGCTTVLLQIDPGPAEERLVEQLQLAHPGAEPGWQPAPASYWQSWRDEIALADHVVVHSEWSRSALAASGVPGHKLVIIPLAYEPPPAAAAFTRQYPARFDSKRPLRVLFLGQVILRKGVMALLEAARELRDAPVEFVVAGPGAVSDQQPHPEGRIRWIGAVPRGHAYRAYQEADVFLFPTVSDGFGLTQLEAQAWRLPVIATRNCGEVVSHGINGVVLDSSSGAEIAHVLRGLAQNPARLAAMSLACHVGDRHRPDRFAESLLRIQQRTTLQQA